MRHLFFAFLMISLGFFVACGGNNSSADSEAAAAADTTTVVEEGVNAAEAAAMEVDSTGPEFTSAYICPMHCKGSGSDVAGTCPVCGMDYVMNPAQGEGTDHMEGAEGHEGHNH